MPRLGEEIGSGAQKYCCKLSNGLVAVVESHSFLLNELRTLRALGRMGLPVWEPKLKQVRHESGNVCWALVGDRYEFMIIAGEMKVKGWLYDEHNRARLKMLQPGHIQALRTIAKQFLKLRLYVHDLQFLVRGTDEVVIADPEGVTFDRDAAFRYTRRILRGWTMYQREQAVLASEAA